MTRLFAAELLKLRTLRSTWGFALVAMLLGSLVTAGNIGGSTEQDRLDPELQFRMVLDAAFPAAILALLMGMILVTNEFRHGTIARTLLAIPRRVRLIGIKLLTGAVTGAVLMLITLVAVAVTAVIWLGILDVPLQLDEAGDGAGRALVGVVLAGVLGAAIGGAVHSQVGALVGALVWIFVAEPICWVILGLLDLDGVSSYLPCRVPGQRRGFERGRSAVRRRSRDGAGLGRPRHGARGPSDEQAGHHVAPGTLGPAVAAPVHKGEELDLRIDSLAYGGNGVARHDGFVVFVRGGLPGDGVRARVTKVKRGFAEGVVSELIHPSSARVAAPCRHFGVCGGCRFQDLAYEAQLAEKERQVRDALVRIGKFADPPLEPIVAAASEFGYRNKLEYSFTASEDGVDLGFHRAGRWDEVIGIEECLLTTEVGNAIRLAVRDWAREERLEPYDQVTGKGYLRHLVVREGRNTGPGARGARHGTR